MSIRAPLGSRIHIIPTSGEPLAYECTNADCYYGLQQGQRGPWRVEARDKNGILLDYSVVSDLHQPIKLIDSTSLQARQQKPEINYGLEVDNRGQPMWGKSTEKVYGDSPLDVLDHRGKPTVTVIGDDAQERMRIIKSLEASPFATKAVFLDYPTGTWHTAFHRVPSGGRSIVIQPAAPSAEVLHRQNDFDFNSLCVALQKVTGVSLPVQQSPSAEAVRNQDPQYRPEADPHLGRSFPDFDVRAFILLAIVIGAVLLLSVNSKSPGART